MATSMRDLRLRVNPLQVTLLKSLSPALTEMLAPVSGVLLGNITLTGSTETYLAIAGDVEHRSRGNVSRIAGNARFAIDERESFDIGVPGAAAGWRNQALRPFPRLARLASARSA